MCPLTKERKGAKRQMGQKMDPHGLRVGVIKDWDSKWYANKKVRGSCLSDIIYSQVGDISCP